MTDFSFIIHEPSDEYHAKSKNGEYMSSHMLSDFRNSPALYRKKILGMVEESSSQAFTIGRAAHSLILEGRNAFDKEFTVSDGPINEKTGEPFGKTTKAYGQWLAQQPGEIISTAEFGTIFKYQSSVLGHMDAAKLLENGAAEGVVRAEYCGVPCQIRMDWFNPVHGLVDLKTCAEIRWFESDCRRYGYIHQLAFYRAVLRMHLGQNVPIYIVAVEKCEPYSAGVWRLTEEVLDLAEMSNKAALERYRNCCATGVWPTGYEDMRIIDTL